MDANLQFHKLESFTDEEHLILQTIIKKKDKIVVQTEEQMNIYRKFIKHITSSIN